jgi:pilus assembly protein Flp/PilA
MIYLMKEFFSRMGQRQEKGQTLIEYALIIALIIVVVIVAMNLLGPTIANAYTKVAGNISGATG